MASSPSNDSFKFALLRSITKILRLDPCGELNFVKLLFSVEIPDCGRAFKNVFFSFGCGKIRFIEESLFSHSYPKCRHEHRHHVQTYSTYTVDGPSSEDCRFPSLTAYWGIQMDTNPYPSRLIRCRIQSLQKCCANLGELNDFKIGSNWKDGESAGPAL